MSAYMSLVITPRGEMPYNKCLLIPEFKELITTERRISLLETSNGRQWLKKGFSFILPSCTCLVRGRHFFSSSLHSSSILLPWTHAQKPPLCFDAGLCCIHQMFWAYLRTLCSVLPLKVFSFCLCNFKENRDIVGLHHPHPHVLSLDGYKLREWVERSCGLGSLCQICGKTGFTC